MTVSKPQCTTCGSSKKVKTALDGTTTCVDVATGCKDENHFQAENNAACYLCSDNTEDTSDSSKNQGTPGCKTCTKNNAKPVCSACLEGYYDSGSSGTVTCTACTGTNCATCTKAEPTKCASCKPGFFLKDASTGECVPCGDTAQGGIDGCAECDNQSGTLKCTKCKPNYKQSGSNPVTCTRACEDPTACGGTAGSCKAAVLDDKGVFHYYCSQCADNSQYPIDGICKSDKAGNTCSNGVCTQCADGYFLYMGGCYKADQPPGNLMCTAAAGGICTTPTGQYFKIPGASNQQQSVLACGNPLGTNTTSTNAYVGLEGCKTCEAPTALSSAGMAAAKCTACDGSKKPTGSGYGCVTCSIAGCSACKADNMCEACGDGYRLEGGTCIPVGGNLSTGAIAGISVAAVVVVGGLVGFLCWWFICRGKA